MTSDLSEKWPSEMEARVRNFHLAYSKAVVAAAAVQLTSARNDGDKDNQDMRGIISLLVARPLSEVEASLDPRTKLTLTFQTRDVYEPLSRASSMRSPSEFFVPDGYRALTQVFTDFVSRRYVAELVSHIDAYLELYVFGRNVLNPFVRNDALPWTLDRQSADAWASHLHRAYIDKAWEKEGWVGDQLDEDLLLRLRTSARSNIREGKVDPIEGPRSIVVCGRLLDIGPEGFWDKNKSELSASFRHEFITGKRKAATISDDGALLNVPWEWWRGEQCTRAMHGRDFVHPKGVILECLSTGAPAVTFEARVSSAFDRLQMSEPARTGAGKNIEDALALMTAMVTDGRIPLKSHTKLELLAIFRKAFPAHPISERGREQVVSQLVSAYPGLKAPKGRPAKGSAK